MNDFNVLLAAATNGTPSGSLFDALFARYIAPQESWRELESPLPITILAAGKALIDYRIYGANDGVGVATKSGEPAGYKLPMVVTNGATTTATPIYIGSDPLAEDEYVDFGEQKVYRRTKNLFPSAVAETKVVNGVTATCDGNGRYSISGTPSKQTNISFTIPKFTFPDVSTTDFVVSFFNAPAANATCIIGQRGAVISMSTANRVFINSSVFSGQEASVIMIGLVAGNSYSFEISPMVVLGTDVPSQFVPPIGPTDPPVPIPALSTIQGETIIDYNPSTTPAVEPEKMYIKYKPQ